MFWRCSSTRGCGMYVWLLTIAHGTTCQQAVSSTPTPPGRTARRVATWIVWSEPPGPCSATRRQRKGFANDKGHGGAGVLDGAAAFLNEENWEGAGDAEFQER